MKSKQLLAGALGLGFVSFFLLQSSTPPPPGIPAFEQQPPIVKSIKVQKLLPPLPPGANMVMKIEYEPDARLSTTMDIYYDDGDYITFHDDGVAPDATSGDGVYSAYLNENVPAFRSEMIALTNNLQDTFLHFTGHLAEAIPGGTVSFDTIDFDSNIEVDVDPHLIDGAHCSSQLLKQNSLFITDLSVVEDSARTFNVVTGAGNPYGVWTFGNLIRNMSTSVSPKAFLKQWLKRWTDDSTIINGQTVYARRLAFRQMIGPWLERANFNNTGAGYHAQTNFSTWEAKWDSANEDSLLIYAPFKLLAIVNRLDLRANQGYTPGSTNAGETRFIFTLVAPINLTSETTVFPTTLAGMPPRGGDGAGGDGACAEPIDWEGMNVIFEYGNPIQNRCDLLDFAYDWADLSGMVLGSANYNSLLEAITHRVIDANAAPGKPNGSAINQVRTNERIFFESFCGANNVNTTWEPANWQLSQFELIGGYLRPAPVTNTPDNLSNAGFNLQKSNSPYNDYLNPSTNSIVLLEWAFAKKPFVHNGVYNMPDSFSYGSNKFRLAATAEMDAEFYHFWDLAWDYDSTTHYTKLDNTPHTYERQMRRQLSLNTCQGCHGGENKTVFTQVRPVGYGVPLKYWSNNVADYTDYQPLDDRFKNGNAGNSNINGSGQMNYYPLPNEVSTVYTVRVSAFLTGRNYSGAGTFQDDWQTTSDDFRDSLFDYDNNSLFYVFDPTNSYDDGTNTDATRPLAQSMNGFNDLEMRKKHLCALINTSCRRKTPSTQILHAVTFYPLPLRGH